MLGQAPLEELGQRLLGDILAGARRAPLEVSAQLGIEVRGEPPVLRVEEMAARVPAATVTSRSP